MNRNANSNLLFIDFSILSVRQRRHTITAKCGHEYERPCRRQRQQPAAAATTTTANDDIQAAWTKWLCSMCAEQFSWLDFLLPLHRFRRCWCYIFFTFFLPCVLHLMLLLCSMLIKAIWNAMMIMVSYLSISYFSLDFLLPLFLFSYTNYYIKKLDTV